MGIINFASPTEPDPTLRSYVIKSINSKWNLASKFDGSKVIFSLIDRADFKIPRSVKLRSRSRMRSSSELYIMDEE
jgi:hypothetical protein